jgi:mono/diheme cytochrome c family protein
VTDAVRCLALCCAGAAFGAQEQAPIVPGLHGEHGLDERQVGELLLSELRCTACHADVAPAPRAPDLSEVGARVELDYLERFLADPAGTQPGTKMPSLLPLEGRAQIARELAHFLVGAAGSGLRHDAARDEDVAAGEALFHTVGCVACHAPRAPAFAGGAVPDARPGAVRLAHVPAKYSLDSLTAFLFQPLRSRPSGRMPDLLLGRGEARAIASYLLHGAAPRSAAAAPSAALAAAGERRYEELGCAACHAPDTLPTARPRAALDPAASCAGARFPLDADQRSAIASALRAPATRADAQRIDAALTALNCIGCHVRGAHGGVDPEVDLYFTTSEPELGEEARIPPQLTDVGAKLTSEWLDRVLFSGAAVRPYMHARMPQFGDAALAGLPALLERVDAVEPYPLALPEGGDAEREARDVGRKLLGSTGGACVSCHAFNGRDSVLRSGIDLVTSYERLRPSWFARFLISPQTYRPGIVMPESWPDGVSVHAELDGSTERQLAALWYFLSLGTSAPEPEGLRAVRNELCVTDTPRTYRGRSSVAGFRGIAVGFPGGVSYAFNAHTGTLSALWKGDFVTVRWDGQGAGGFNPGARAVELAQDTSFARLAREDAAWPRAPHMDKDAPVDPDPLYPRNVGYRFRGYSLDEASIPTFAYRSGDVLIEDRSRVEAGAGVHLRRALSFASPVAETLHMRVLTGAIEKVADGRYRVPRLEVRVPEQWVVLRPLGASETDLELLLALPLPAGPSRLAIDYVLPD